MSYFLMAVVVRLQGVVVKHISFMHQWEEYFQQRNTVDCTGQTVSSNFGTIDSAQYNIEQLIHAGISNDLFSTQLRTLSEKQENLLQELADESYESYMQLKNHPDFLDYLVHVSPLNFIAKQISAAVRQNEAVLQNCN